MIKMVYGDALKNDCDVLCHQVNLQGVMGGGIALQIARAYPKVEKEYIEYEPKKLGEVCFSSAESYVVANCFSQNQYVETDYVALKTCMQKVLNYMDENGFKSVAFPYRYGCGIANGDWSKVLSIIAEVLENKTVRIYALKQE